MRRIYVIALGVLALAGLAVTAGTAYAEESSPSRPTRPIQLACTQADGSITCTWNALDGATAYRVHIVYRHGRRGAFESKKVTEPTVTFSAARAGNYNVVVQALGADGKPMGRSNRVHVKVEAPSTTSPTVG